MKIDNIFWSAFLLVAFIVMLFCFNDSLEEERQNSLQMSYSVWVKTTGNTANLTFEEWKHLPRPIQITIK
jgi:hypothetical protein